MRCHQHCLLVASIVATDSTGQDNRFPYDMNHFVGKTVSKGRTRSLDKFVHWESAARILK